MTISMLPNHNRTLRSRTWVLWLIVLVAALVAPLIANERQLFVLMTILTLAVFSTSFNILLGYTGMVSFAHAAFYGVGAYTVALLWLHLGWSPLVGFLLAPLTAAVAAFLLGLIALRATRLYFALLTLALGQLLFLITFQWRDVTRGDDGIHGVEVPSFLGPSVNKYYFLLLLTVLALGVMGIALRAPFGATLRSIRENRDRAGFLGIRVRRYELAAFTFGGAFAGYAGGMFVMFNRDAFPLLLHWTTSGEPIYVTLIGGLNSFGGPVVGAVIYGLLRDWVTRKVVYWAAALGAVLLIIILFLPGGLVEGFQRLSSLRRRAETDTLSEPAQVGVALDDPADSQGRP